MEKIAEAFKTAHDIVAGLAKDGKLLSDKKHAQERFLVCLECEHLNPENFFCNICGCNMQIKVKILRARCPDNPRRW